MHSQIKGILKELKKTCYRPSYTILGSREQYCIFEDVRKSDNRNDECRRKISMQKCPYFTQKDKLINFCKNQMGLEKKKFPSFDSENILLNKSKAGTESKVLDVEYLVKNGKGFPILF